MSLDNIKTSIEVMSWEELENSILEIEKEINSVTEKLDNSGSNIDLNYELDELLELNELLRNAL